MPSVKVEGQILHFPKGWKAEKYDGWVFYERYFKSVCGGAKAVDVVALEPRECCWLIEVKDYRTGHQTTTADVAEAVARKVRDTLAGLAAARVRADGEEKRYADEALATTRLRVVVHMELPPPASPLFAAALDQAAVLQQLRQRIKAVDPKLEVVDSGRIDHLPWTVS